jgi:uncharacterized protein YjdB
VTLAVAGLVGAGLAVTAVPIASAHDEETIADTATPLGVGETKTVFSWIDACSAPGLLPWTLAGRVSMYRLSLGSRSAVQLTLAFAADTPAKGSFAIRGPGVDYEETRLTTLGEYSPYGINDAYPEPRTVTLEMEAGTQVVEVESWHCSGTATLTLDAITVLPEIPRAGDGSQKAVSSVVPVAKSVKIKGPKTLVKGSKAKLSVVVKPARAKGKVTFTSKNPKVASVNSKGVIKGLKRGTTVIKAVAPGGAKATLKVRVK